MRALITKEFRELARDRRTLAMLILLPVLLLTIFGYAANFQVERVQAVVVGENATELAAELEGYDATAEGLDIVSVAPEFDESDGERMLRDGGAEIIIVATVAGGDAANSDEVADDAPLTDRIHALVDGSSLFAAQAAQRTVMELVGENAQQRLEETRETVEEARVEADESRADLERFVDELHGYGPRLQEALASGQQAPAPPTPPEVTELPELPEITAPNLNTDDLSTTLFNPDLKTSWVMIPGLIGLILTFIGMIITSIGLVRERETGTLEQLAVMPLAPSTIILGKIVPYFILAVIDMALVTLLGVWLFDVPFVGSVWVFALAALVFLFVVLGLGVLVSSVSQSTGQAIQMAIMLLLPQVLLSGLIFPLESMAAGVRWIGYVLPLTWFNEISQGVMLRGAAIDALWLPFGVLAVSAVLIFGLATFRMRLSLTRGGAR